MQRENFWITLFIALLWMVSSYFEYKKKKRKQTTLPQDTEPENPELEEAEEQVKNIPLSPIPIHEPPLPISRTLPKIFIAKPTTMLSKKPPPPESIPIFDLKEAVIMSEILGKPLALRKTSEF